MADLFPDTERDGGRPPRGASATKAWAITPNDGADLDLITRALYVGGAGDVSVILRDDSGAVTLVAVPAGSLLPIRVKRVRATGTTATSIVGLC